MKTTKIIAGILLLFMAFDASAQDRTTCRIIFDSTGGSVKEGIYFPNSLQVDYMLEGQMLCYNIPGMEQHNDRALSIVDQLNPEIPEAISRARRDQLRRCFGLAQVAMSNPSKYELEISVGAPPSVHPAGRLVTVSSSRADSVFCYLRRNLTAIQ